MSAEPGFVWVILKRQGIADTWTSFAFWAVAESRDAALKKMQGIIGGPWHMQGRGDGDWDVHMGKMDWVLKRFALEAHP